MALLGKGIFNKLQILLVIQRRQGMKRRVCRRFITVFIIELTRWFAWWISFRCVQRGDVGAKASESKTRWPWLTAGNPPAVTPLGSQARDFMPTFPICYDFLFRDRRKVPQTMRWGHRDCKADHSLRSISSVSKYQLQLEAPLVSNAMLHSHSYNSTESNGMISLFWNSLTLFFFFM